MPYPPNPTSSKEDEWLEQFADENEAAAGQACLIRNIYRTLGDSLRFTAAHCRNSPLPVNGSVLGKTSTLIARHRLTDRLLESACAADRNAKRWRRVGDGYYEAMWLALDARDAWKAKNRRKIGPLLDEMF